jgi:hypothetical protein
MSADTKPAVDVRGKTSPLIAATLRTLAGDLRSGADLSALLAAIGRALAAVPSLRGFTVEPLGEAVEFSSDRLTVPLLGGSGAIGQLKVASGGGGFFRPSRLQLAGALAELAAVVVDHALVARTRTAPAELISIALTDLPVGVLCFDGSGALVFANAAAHQALGGRVPADWPAVWSTLAPAARREPGTAFILREGSRLVHVTARRSSPTGPSAVVLTDLAARVNAFNEVLSAEVYRSLVEKLPLSIGVVSASEGSPAALEALEAARATLPVGARIGPIDGEAVAVLVAREQAGSLWPALREISRVRGGADVLRGGVAALRAGGDTPGALLARAIAEMRPLAVDPRPGVLVCDRSPVVNDTLALVLRRDFSVMCSAQWNESLALLEEQAFDGLVLELPPRGDARAQAFALRALELQPAAQPFFVTDLPGPWDTAEVGRPDRPVFRKPFVVRDVRAAFKGAFAR